MYKTLLKSLSYVFLPAFMLALTSCADDGPDGDDDVTADAYFIKANINGATVNLIDDNDLGYNLDFHISPGVSEPIACNEVGGGIYWDDFLGGTDKGSLYITMPYQCSSDYSYYDDDDFFQTLFEMGDYDYDADMSGHLEGIEIQWVDPAGNFYSSKYGAQDGDAFFTITFSEAVADNSITGNAAHEIKANFACTLYKYDDLTPITLTDGETWLVFNNI